MANADVIVFNIAAFVTALFLLEAGADKFIDHTAIVAHRISVPQGLIALLTAGAEWEELVVVVASLSRNRSSLAVGNVIGSAISNILGAFSIGLMAHTQGIEFDLSSRIYSVLLLLITTLVAPLTYFTQRNLWITFGSILLALFVTYVVSIAWSINRGTITAPEGSDDSDDDSSGIDDSSDGEADETASDVQRSHNENVDPSYSARDTVRTSSEALLNAVPSLQRKRHKLGYHVAFLIVGFFTICLSGYVLSHTATTIVDEIGVSDILFGIIILSIATTLPEKFVAVLSGKRGQSGILVANTVGSNIFLLTLCMGIIMVQTEGQLNASTVKIAELCVMWGSTLAFTLTVWFGSKWSRSIGGLMLIAYIVFIILEFTIIHRGTGISTLAYDMFYPEGLSTWFLINGVLLIVSMQLSAKKTAPKTKQVVIRSVQRSVRKSMMNSDCNDVPAPRTDSDEIVAPGDSEAAILTGKPRG